MALKIISAEERLAESRGIKAAIFGGSGQGKTSLLQQMLTLCRCSSPVQAQVGVQHRVRCGGALFCCRTRSRVWHTSPCPLTRLAAAPFSLTAAPAATAAPPLSRLCRQLHQQQRQLACNNRNSNSSSSRNIQGTCST